MYNNILDLRASIEWLPDAGSGLSYPSEHFDLSLEPLALQTGLKIPKFIMWIDIPNPLPI